VKLVHLFGFIIKESKIAYFKISLAKVQSKRIYIFSLFIGLALIKVLILLFHLWTVQNAYNPKPGIEDDDDDNNNNNNNNSPLLSL